MFQLGCFNQQLENPWIRHFADLLSTFHCGFFVVLRKRNVHSVFFLHFLLLPRKITWQWENHHFKYQVLHSDLVWTGLKWPVPLKLVGDTSSFMVVFLLVIEVIKLYQHRPQAVEEKQN